VVFEMNVIINGKQWCSEEEKGIEKKIK